MLANLMTIQFAADKCERPAQELLDAIQNKQLKATKINGVIYTQPEDLEAWINSPTLPAGESPIENVNAGIDG